MLIKLNLQSLPNHIAIIMDGNGRGAKSKMLPRSIGHKNGVHSVQLISEACSKLKISYLTLYTLSLENFDLTQLQDWGFEVPMTLRTDDPKQVKIW